MEKHLEEKVKQNHETLIKVLEQCPELVLFGSEGDILRTPTEVVSVEVGLATAEKLKNTLKKYRAIAGFGRGLAAPQIGIRESVFVTFVDEKFQTYINPKILIKSGSTNFYRELCLSCAYTMADVKRPQSITIEYINESGEIVRETHDGFMARLLQHEYDHLEGVLNVDIVEKGGLSLALSDPLKEQLRDTR